MAIMTAEKVHSQAIAHIPLARLIAVVMTEIRSSICSGVSAIPATHVESTKTMASLGLYLAGDLAGSKAPHAEESLQLTGAAKTKD